MTTSPVYPLEDQPAWIRYIHGSESLGGDAKLPGMSASPIRARADVRRRLHSQLPPHTRTKRPQRPLRSEQRVSNRVLS
jgi:hypothetical protein